MIHSRGRTLKGRLAHSCPLRYFQGYIKNNLPTDLPWSGLLSLYQFQEASAWLKHSGNDRAKWQDLTARLSRLCTGDNSQLQGRHHIWYLLCALQRVQVNYTRKLQLKGGKNTPTNYSYNQLPGHSSLAVQQVLTKYTSNALAMLPTVSGAAKVLSTDQRIHKVEFGVHWVNERVRACVRACVRA